MNYYKKWLKIDLDRSQLIKFVTLHTVHFHAQQYCGLLCTPKSESHADFKAYTTFETDSCYTAFIFNSL